LGNGWQAKEVAVAWKVRVIDAKDNVGAIISNAAERGVTVKVEAGGKSLEVTAQGNIHYGHKIALVPLKQSETIDAARPGHEVRSGPEHDGGSRVVTASRVRRSVHGSAYRVS